MRRTAVGRQLKQTHEKFVSLSMGKIELEFKVDRLTDSILNTISGDSFQTDVSKLRKSDLKFNSKEGLEV